MNTLVKQEPSRMYHIYNRGNNRENIFIKDKNYDYFLKLYERYICPVADTYAYCLLRNHFHLMIRVKTEPRLSKSPRLGKSDVKSEVPEIVSEQFRLFFMAYSKAINKQEGRTGSLFQKNFRRKEVTTREQSFQLIYYIHRNPKKHGFTKDFRNYPFSSYDQFVSGSNSFLDQKEVLGWFGTLHEFRAYHEEDRTLDEKDMEDEGE